MTTFPLQLLVELNIRSLGWLNITPDVRTSEDIRISGGRRDYSAKVNPATCSFKLNNRDGRYSDENPRSPYFGLLGRNTPLRVSLPGDESYLEILEGEGRCSTPATPAIAPTGDLDVRVEATGDWYRWAPRDVSQSLIGQYLPTGGNLAWVLFIDTNGSLRFTWSTTGSDNYFVSGRLPEGIPERAAFRATLDVDTGSGGSRATTYWAETMDGPWNELTHYDTATPQPIYGGSTADLQLPVTNLPEALHGRIHRAVVLNGIGGVALAAPDFRGLAPGTTEFTDTAGLTWTVTGDARITDRDYLFTGEVSAWPQRWDVSGADVWVPLQAAGILRRLGQGTKPLQSTLRRRIPVADPAPIAYWPMEEGSAASRAYSPLPDVDPLRTSGLRWASATGLPSSDPLPTLGQQASLRADVPATSTRGWQVEMVYKADGMPGTLQRLWRANLSGATNASYVQALVGANSIRMETRDEDDQLLVGFTATDPTWIAAYSAGWTRMQFYCGVDAASEAYWAIAWRDIVSNIFYNVYIFDFPDTVPGAITNLVGNWGSDFAGFALGHLAIFDVAGTAEKNPAVNVFDGADTALAGETTIGRMRRLAGEEKLDLHITGEPAQTELVGPQRVDTILNLLQSAADVDGGLLHEKRDEPILAYRARHTLYNQTPALTLDYTAPGEVPPGLQPVKDDQNTRNDITVTRKDGSSAVATQETGPLSVEDPPEGAGRYNTEVTVNAYTDDQLQDLAGWRLHLGTWPGSRYPQVKVNLRAAPHLIPAVRTLGLLDRLQILNPPQWLPPDPIDLLVQGYTHIVNAYRWEVTYNTSPAGPWTVSVIAPDNPAAAGTDQPNRADTTVCAVAADAAATDTELLVHTPQDADSGEDRAVWVTSAGGGSNYPAEFPFDVRVAGETVRITACEPRIWDSFNRTVADGWGTAPSGEAWGVAGGTATEFSVTGGQGAIALPSPITSLRIMEQLVVLGDCDVIACMSVDQAATGGDLLSGIFVRGNGPIVYWIDLAWQADGQVGLEVRNVVTVVGTRVATGYNYAPGDRMWLHARVIGDGRVLARTWPDGQLEPHTWQIDRTIPDGSTTPAGTVGIIAAGTGTNTNPTVNVQAFRVADPQLMTVQRSLNGVIKAQSVGADVRLAQPAIVAL